MCSLPGKIKYFHSWTKEKPSEIPYGTQLINNNDVKAVVDALYSPLIAQGPRVERFEKSLAEKCDAEYAVVVNSGTSALHIACLAAGVKRGDEVITSPNTFVASANCTIYCGGKPVFADIDKRTYNISPSEIEKRITQNTKAIIPVHFAGQSCDMESISQIVKEAERKYGHKIFIIEDGCHALGSEYKSSKVGACAYSDMTVMSFHPVKHITTGEGGAVLTNDKFLSEKLVIFRSHGITKEPEKLINKDSYFASTSINNTPYINQWWYYEQIDLGYNYRMTDLQGALGLSQLEKLDYFCKKRSDIVRRYNKAFNGLKNIQIPFESKECDSNFHLYVLLIDFDQMDIKRSQYMIELKKKGIQTQVHYIPVNIQPYYQEKFRTGWGDCPNAEEYYQKCISIPLFPSMTNNEVERVINSIKGD
ncbi:MAG: UDP-4-amino-4,6-dideoxy-N-acetyl-beta-L-altrosamine transaminase [Candidatus Scalindua sp.]